MCIMQFLIVLATLIAGFLCQPIVKSWTLNELSTAIEKNSNKDMQPYLIDALNKIMYALYTGKDQEVNTLIPSPTGGKVWTMDQLKKAIDDSETNPNLQPFIMRSLHQLIMLNADGNHKDSIEVAVPALDISVWTISDVQEAKDDPNTNPGLLPYLKKAEDQIQEALKSGKKKEEVRVTLVSYVGLVPGNNFTIRKIIPRSSPYDVPAL